MEISYIDALIDDFTRDASDFNISRPISSIFIGGGTPSLLSSRAFARLLAHIDSTAGISSEAEITIEANPGTLDDASVKFPGYIEAGINRLSVGAQSFSDDSLGVLGRIHRSSDIDAALAAARSAGFERINVDLMHGLPGQTIPDAAQDLERAITLGADHISWYQLTLEPNTVFYSRPPQLPDEDTLASIQDAGFAQLASAGFDRYEISAFARPGEESRHNLNYWQFGDYLGIGAGAHGKITTPEGIYRTSKTRLPRDYLSGRKTRREKVESDAVMLEFLMNALRLPAGFGFELFEERTGLDRAALAGFVDAASSKGLIHANDHSLMPTARGLDYLNDLLLLADEDTLARG